MDTANTMYILRDYKNVHIVAKKIIGKRLTIRYIIYEYGILPEKNEQSRSNRSTKHTSCRACVLALFSYKFGGGYGTNTFNTRLFNNCR